MKISDDHRSGSHIRRSTIRELGASYEPLCVVCAPCRHILYLRRESVWLLHSTAKCRRDNASGSSGLAKKGVSGHINALEGLLPSQKSTSHVTT